MITFQEESFEACLPELKPLFEIHWKEIALHQDIIKLDMCYDEYIAIEKQGGLHLIVARDAGRIVGYHLAFIRPHLHYRQSLSAIVDIYFVLPSHRGGTGMRMLRFAEKSLKARGVQKIFTACKLHHDVGRLFDRLGYQEIERMYAKVLT